MEPDAIVLTAVVPSRLEPVLGDIEAMSNEWRVYLAGAGASAEIAARANAQYLTEGPIVAAGTLAATVRRLPRRA